MRAWYVFGVGTRGRRRLVTRKRKNGQGNMAEYCNAQQAQGTTAVIVAGAPANGAEIVLNCNS